MPVIDPVHTVQLTVMVFVFVALSIQLGGDLVPAIRDRLARRTRKMQALAALQSVPLLRRMLVHRGMSPDRFRQRTTRPQLEAAVTICRACPNVVRCETTSNEHATASGYAFCPNDTLISRVLRLEHPARAEARVAA